MRDPQILVSNPRELCSLCGEPLGFRPTGLHPITEGDDRAKRCDALAYDHHTSCATIGPPKARPIGWGVLSAHDAERWLERLTLQLVDSFTQREYTETMFVHEGNQVLVPRGLGLEGAPISWTVPDKGGLRAFGPQKPVSLRDYQHPAVNAMTDALRQDYQGTLVAGCGTGKTTMSLEIARRLGLKTLVLVHKEFLLEQWRDRAQEFLPGVRVGVWRQDTFEVEDVDITIATVQSITSSRTYPAWAYRAFGLVIVDEMHHGAAATWVEAITRFSSAYRLGLSATPERRDGRHEMCYLHIGRPAHTLSVPRDRAPRVARITLHGQYDPKGYTQAWDGEVNFANLTTTLTKDEERTARIVSEVVRAVRAGRKPVVYSDRRQHVFDIVSALKAELGDDYTVEEFVGGVKSADLPAKLEALDDANVMVATYKQGEEALDVQGLDTVFLATPRTSVQQVTGRIDRPGASVRSEKPPLIVDFVDTTIPALNGFWSKRRRLYEGLGYEV